jgi:hypothetical protein
VTLGDALTKNTSVNTSLMVGNVPLLRFQRGHAPPLFLERSIMKSMLLALVAYPLVGFSSLTFAQDRLPTEQPASQEPVVLSQVDMDSVTAAGELVSVGNVDARNNQVQVVIVCNSVVCAQTSVTASVFVKGQGI